MYNRLWWRKFLHVVTALAAPIALQLSPRSMASQCADVSPKTKRLTAVPGFEDRKNDIVFCQQGNLQKPESRVVFFGGDSQDYPEQMSAHRDNYRYLQWNLLSTAEILNMKFPTSEIYIVKPSRVELKTFSCYDNFIVTQNLGTPKHVPNNNAILHLRALISNAITLANSESNSSDYHGDRKALPDIFAMPIILIGFSKGCVVLNQILYELSLMSTKPEVENFINRVSHMYWLDGGHPGGFNTWITKTDILKKLASLNVTTHVIVTPYQIQDERRPWLRKEEKTFSTTLAKLNARIVRHVLFEDQPGDIMLHFQVLNDFPTGFEE